MLNAKQIGQMILEEVLTDNGDMSRREDIFKRLFSPSDIEAMEQAIEACQQEGLVFDEEAIEQLGSGEESEVDMKFSEFEGYPELKVAIDQVLNRYL